MIEWYVQLESNPGVTSDGVFWGAVNGTIVIQFNNMQFNQAGDDPGFNEFYFAPFYGGGGSSPTSNYYVAVGRLEMAQG